MGVFQAGVGVSTAVGGAFLRARAARETADAIEDAARFRNMQIRRTAGDEAARLRRFARRKISSQEVAFAKANVELSGSALERLLQNASELERDAANVEIAAAESIALNESRGENAQRIGRQRSAASLLTGVGGAALFSTDLLRRRG